MFNALTFEEEKMLKDFLKRYGKISPPFLQRKLKRTFEECEQICKIYDPKIEKIDNFKVEVQNPKITELIREKIPSSKVSITYLQIRLNLSYAQTETLFNKWINGTPEERKHKKFNALNKLIKPSRPNKEGALDKYIDEQGYVIVYKPGHPNSDSSGFIKEHTYVMSLQIKRALKKRENVHHKNGIRSDNRIENLELWDKVHPPGQRVVDKIAFYKEYLESHGYEVKKHIKIHKQSNVNSNLAHFQPDEN